MLLPTTQRALLHRVAVSQAEGRTPSLIATIVRDGEVVWTGSRSSVLGQEPTDDTQFRIGSLTKTFVAVLVMRLRDEGLIELGRPLATYLPGTQAGSATIAQLLSHSSGLSAEPRGPWWERTSGELRPDVRDLVEEPSQALPPGRRLHYSNTAYALLGALIEQLRGTSWDQALWNEVLEPLGMRRTTLLPQAPHAEGWAVHPWADVMQGEPLTDTGKMAPAGQLWSTTSDLAVFAAFLSGALTTDVLSSETLAEMRTPTSAQSAGSWDAAWGLGVQLIHAGEGRVLAGHGGSMPGFLAALYVSVEEDIGVVLLTNVTSGVDLFGTVGDLVRIVAEHEPRMPAPWRPLDDVDQDLLELTGTWYWGASPLTLRLAADRWLEIGPLDGSRGRASRFRPERDGSWTGLDGYYAGETLRVMRDESGSVSHLDVATFVFTRSPYEQGAPVPGGTQVWGE